MPNSLSPQSETDSLVEDAPYWCKVHCFQCNRLVGKFTAYPIDEQNKHVAKVCLESWCRHCKIRIYKTVVI